jgi:hypothetical protein
MAGDLEITLWNETLTLTGKQKPAQVSLRGWLLAQY